MVDIVVDCYTLLTWYLNTKYVIFWGYRSFSGISSSYSGLSAAGWMPYCVVTWFPLKSLAAISVLPPEALTHVEVMCKRKRRINVVMTS